MSAQRAQQRQQVTLLPECLEDYIAEDNPVREVEAFVEELDLKAPRFERALPAQTGRPAYHPAVLLKIYIYGYLNRVSSSRRLEMETADRTQPGEAPAKAKRLDRKIERLREQMKHLGALKEQLQSQDDQQLSVRHAQTLDGIDPLPHARTSPREH